MVTATNKFSIAQFNVGGIYSSSIKRDLLLKQLLKHKIDIAFLSEIKKEQHTDISSTERVQIETWFRIIDCSLEIISSVAFYVINEY
jgi:exonuclease III